MMMCMAPFCSVITSQNPGTPGIQIKQEENPLCDGCSYSKHIMLWNALKGEVKLTP